MPLKKTSTTKSVAVKKPEKKISAKPGTTKKKALKEPLSSAKKKVIVRHIKSSGAPEKIAQVAAPALAVHQVSGKKNIIPIRKHGAIVEQSIHEDDFREKIEANTDVKDTTKAEVKHYDLDEKINFKNLNAKSHNIYRKLAFSFLIFTSLLLVAVLYLYYVKVDISIVLNKQHVNGNAIINVTNDVLSSSTSSNLPGVVKEVELAQSREFTATGKQVLGSDVTGRVKITNSYVRNQPLVASTRLLAADGQLVRVKETVNVPAGGSVEVEVFSSEATSSVNIPSGARLTIPGLWQGIQDKVYAESLTAITYQEKTKTIISEEDIETAKTLMKEELETKAKAEVLDVYKGQYSQVLYKVDENSFVARVDAKAGEEKDTFNIVANARMVVTAFNGQSAQKQAEDQLMAQLPGDKGLAEFDQDSITYELGNVDLLGGVATVNVGYTGTVINKNANIIDKNKIVGLTATQLESFIKNLKDENNNPLIDSYAITFTPSFIGRVPNWPDRINITPLVK